MILIRQGKKSRKNSSNLREQMQSASTSLEVRNVETFVGWTIFLTLYGITSSYNGCKLCIFPNDNSQED